MLTVLVGSFLSLGKALDFDSDLRDLGSCMISLRFLLVDAGIVDAMAWCGLEKFVGGC